jgi:DNA-binding IclR family transcriptional regulator
MAEILELLSDGKWHAFEEIQKTTKLTENNFLRVIQFLKEYSFVVVDEEKRRIRLDENARNFLAQALTS